jgi:hypothetical protein
MMKCIFKSRSNLRNITSHLFREAGIQLEEHKNVRTFVLSYLIHKINVVRRKYCYNNPSPNGLTKRKGKIALASLMIYLDL